MDYMLLLMILHVSSKLSMGTRKIITTPHQIRIVSVELIICLLLIRLTFLILHTTKNFCFVAAALSDNCTEYVVLKGGFKTQSGEKNYNLRCP